MCYVRIVGFVIMRVRHSTVSLIVYLPSFFVCKYFIRFLRTLNIFSTLSTCIFMGAQEKKRNDIRKDIGQCEWLFDKVQTHETKWRFQLFRYMFVTHAKTLKHYGSNLYTIFFPAFFGDVVKILAEKMNRKNNSFVFTFQAYDITLATRAIHCCCCCCCFFVCSSFSFSWLLTRIRLEQRLETNITCMSYYWCNWHFLCGRWNISFVLWNTKIRFSFEDRENHSSVEWCTVG